MPLVFIKYALEQLAQITAIRSLAYLPLEFWMGGADLAV
jgi:hypothetical protein